MLFNSPSFIFGFLPAVLAGFFVLGRYASPRVAILWLGLASLVFYGFDNPALQLPLILVSIAFNFIVGRALARTGRRALLVTGVVGNLLLLGFFKYAGLLLGTVADLTGLALPRPDIPLPIGISFYTFTQIAFLVDASRGEAKEYDPVHYALFVTYFPHLIAGPILHHKEMMPQFKALAPGRLGAEDFAVGLTIFVIGLFKKVVLADGVARFVPFAFGAEAAEPGLVAAWTGALAYTLQLYFDFSGYSDMAVGLSRLFGVDLPLNFASPYKSTSVIEFWRRWHMTLSRFLRDYLYIPLGGGRRGPARRHANLMATMLLGGLWHGAGWTFVLWGGLHGAYLVANHLWRALKARLGLFPGEPTRARLLAAGALTFRAVVVAWVPFRAASFAQAHGVLAGMAGLNGTALGTLPEGPSLPLAWLWIAGLLALAWFAPNAQEIMARHLPQMRRATAARGLLLWRPTAWHAALLGLAAVVALGHLANVSEFLYFQF
jgi:alginate O-acetyltransferase complex protein AlgI